MASKLWINPGSSTTFTPSGGDVTFTLTSLGAGAGRQSDTYNAGAAPRVNRYLVEFVVLWDSAPTVGETAELYLKTFSESNAQGLNDDGASDAAVSAEDKLRNLVPVITVQADEAVADIATVGRAVVENDSRYFQFVVWNRSAADTFSATANDCYVRITPCPYEAQ